MITISSIPHDQQRYPTVGDYVKDSFGNIHIRVSLLDNPKYITLVAIHELVEALLVHHRGISIDAIDQFDMRFEKAPYYAEHQIATEIEKLMASCLDVNWKEYEKAINAL